MLRMLVGSVRQRGVVQAQGRRYFWAWVNMMFNKVDDERVKAVGPDVACAEWLLRNGGAVRWSRAVDFTSDYNTLALADRNKKIEEIDASGSGISHYGFAHLKNCRSVRRIVLHDCSYVDDTAVRELCHVSSPLEYLQISKCNNVTDAGLESLPALDRLANLVLFELQSVKDLEKCRESLQRKLPSCKIECEKPS